jgi:hypothetical protein
VGLSPKLHNDSEYREQIRHLPSLMSATTKKLMLGTAQWGWSVSKVEAFQLLDIWLKAGHKAVDCATNYPINRNPEHFRAAEMILKEFVDTHGIRNRLYKEYKDLPGVSLEKFNEWYDNAKNAYAGVLSR